MKPYPSYKDSGIEWIGKIPKEWKQGKIKHNVSIMKKSGLPASEGKEVGLHPFFTSSQIQDKFINEAVINDECLILGSGGSANIHYANGKFSASNDCLVLKRQKNIIIKFLYYLFLSNIKVIDDLGFNGIGLKHLQRGFFDNMPIYFPATPEQLSIVSYIDRKTAQIDELISKKEKLIELLKEERTAIINEAVTKGINIDVEYKDSGIEWIGKIPKHWIIKKLKYVSSLNSKVLPETTDENYEFNYVDISNVNLENGFKLEEKINFRSAPLRARRIVKKGDTIISTVRTYLKAVTYFKDEVKDIIVSTGFAVVSPNNKIIPKFFYYILRSEEFINRICALSVGVSYPAINSTELSNIHVWYPEDIKEQEKIVKYLDRVAIDTKEAISCLESEIYYLKEYRAVLISEAVTGKIDVRGYAV